MHQAPLRTTIPANARKPLARRPSVDANAAGHRLRPRRTKDRRFCKHANSRSVPAQTRQDDRQEGPTESAARLYEIDATIEADSLDADRANSYRVFVRAVYYQGQETKPVDSSQWTELLLQPGDPVPFSSASLTGADRCLLEVAYPEEVGLK